MTQRSKPKAHAKHPGGRPRKFDETSHPITVTLPERTLRLLAGVNEDRAKAIVKVTDLAVSGNQADTPPIQLTEIARGCSIMIVGPSERLRQIPGLQLVEIAPARYLLSVPSGTPLESLELSIMDQLAGMPGEGEEREKDLLGKLHQYIGQLRREKRMSKSEIILINT